MEYESSRSSYQSVVRHRNSKSGQGTIVGRILLPIPERLVLSNYATVTSLEDFSTSFNIELELLTIV